MVTKRIWILHFRFVYWILWLGVWHIPRTHWHILFTCYGLLLCLFIYEQSRIQFSWYRFEGKFVWFTVYFEPNWHHVIRTTHMWMCHHVSTNMMYGRTMRLRFSLVSILFFTRYNDTFISTTLWILEVFISHCATKWSVLLPFSIASMCVFYIWTKCVNEIQIPS